MTSSQHGATPQHFPDNERHAVTSPLAKGFHIGSAPLCFRNKGRISELAFPRYWTGTSCLSSPRFLHRQKHIHALIITMLSKMNICIPLLVATISTSSLAAPQAQAADCDCYTPMEGPARNGFPEVKVTGDWLGSFKLMPDGSNVESLDGSYGQDEE